MVEDGGQAGVVVARGRADESMLLFSGDDVGGLVRRSEAGSGVWSEDLILVIALLLLPVLLVLYRAAEFHGGVDDLSFAFVETVFGFCKCGGGLATDFTSSIAGLLDHSQINVVVFVGVLEVAEALLVVFDLLDELTVLFVVLLGHGTDSRDGLFFGGGGLVSSGPDCGGASHDGVALAFDRVDFFVHLRGMAFGGGHGVDSLVEEFLFSVDGTGHTKFAGVGGVVRERDEVTRTGGGGRRRASGFSVRNSRNNVLGNAVDQGVACGGLAAHFFFFISLQLLGASDGGCDKSVDVDGELLEVVQERSHLVFGRWSDSDETWPDGFGSTERDIELLAEEFELGLGEEA